MIEETATVVALEGGDAWVSAATATGCHGCAAQQGCGSGVLARYLGARPRRLRLANRLGVEVGDEVVLGLRESAIVSGSFLVYVYPLLGLLGGATVANRLSVNLGLNSEMAAIIGGGLGAALALAMVRRRVGRDTDAFRPIMLRRRPGGDASVIVDN